MRLVKVKPVDGRPVYINIERIEKVYIGEKSVEIELIGGRCIPVEGRINEVVEAIKEACNAQD